MTSIDEFVRVSKLLSDLTISIPILMIKGEEIERISKDAISDETLASLDRELRAKLKAVKRPEDHVQMAQAYEAYSEASFYLEMKHRGVVLERTTGTGEHQEKRPDFQYSHASGNLYFEVKALEIAEPLRRHKEISHKSLELRAELDGRAREPGVHFGEPHEISGHLPNADPVTRIDNTIQKISNNIKAGQIEYGPTVLVVDLGRLFSVPQGPSGLLPVYFHEGEPAESCVSGELWQIARGLPGEQIFSLPEFDGKSNLAGHQTQTGILRQFPTLMAITFFLPRFSTKTELLTIWNIGWDQGALENACTLNEQEIGAILDHYSNGLNDEHNERGWKFRKYPPP